MTQGGTPQGLLKTYCFSALVEGQRGFNFNNLIQFWLLIMEARQLAGFKVQGGCTYISREFAPWTPLHSGWSWFHKDYARTTFPSSWA